MLIFFIHLIVKLLCRTILHVQEPTPYMGLVREVITDLLVQCGNDVVPARLAKPTKVEPLGWPSISPTAALHASSDYSKDHTQLTTELQALPGWRHSPPRLGNSWVPVGHAIHRRASGNPCRTTPEGVHCRGCQSVARLVYWVDSRSHLLILPSFPPSVHCQVSQDLFPTPGIKTDNEARRSGSLE